MAGNLRRIPNFVRARSAQGLRRAMARQQLRDSAEYAWWFAFNTADGFWYAWYTPEPAPAGVALRNAENQEDGNESARQGE